MLTPEEISTLISTAQKARDMAFVPKTDHKIGAALCTTDNQYFGGCNVESTISGLGTCAERSAIDHAVIHGRYEFKAMCVVDETLEFPCGACLQYITLFAQITDLDMPIIVADITGSYKIYSLGVLLPHGYKTKHQLDKLKSYRNRLD